MRSAASPVRPGSAAAGSRFRGIAGGEADAREVWARARRARRGARAAGAPPEQPERDDAARAGQLCEPAAPAGGCEIGDHSATRTLAIRRETSAGLGTN